MRLTTLFLGACLSFGIHAENVIDLSESAVVKNAAKMGLSIEEHMFAGKKFQQLLESGETPDNLSPITQSVEYANALAYINSGQKVPKDVELSLVKAMNTRKAAMASYLGLDVSKLDEYTRAFFDYDYQNKYENSVSSKAKRMERIVVHCSDDYCSKGPWGANILRLRLFVTTTAENAGITRRGERFQVDIHDEKTDEKIGEEIWEQNVFSGAFKVETRPCEECEIHL